ncbi:hypothetical protein ALC62_02787, partial [Cyphomyrmex costatus]
KRLQGIECREEKKVERRREETEEEKRRVRWRRLECPRTTNGADTTGLPFTVYLLVVSLQLRTFNVHAKGLNASHPARQPKFVHHVRVTGVRADRYESV